MKNKIVFTIKIFTFIIFLSSAIAEANNYGNNHSRDISDSFVSVQDTLNGNNMSSFIWNTGIFNQNLYTINNPGCEWPKGSGKFINYTAGLSISAYVNGAVRLAAASYTGEYSPGYCVNGSYFTNANFRFFKIRRGYTPSTPDWANWGLMVPYGAPYIDVNHNGTYEPAIDTPGVRSASECIFICLTDADPLSHSATEGFAGGTTPLGAELHLTAWCYGNPGYQDMQFFRWEIINKSSNVWDSTNFSIVSDPDLGNANDDRIGCDSTLGLGYIYNDSDMDGNGSGFTYGSHPPAAGFVMLNTNQSMASMTSFNEFICASCPSPVCEHDPIVPLQSYNFLSGKKRDATPYLVPNTLHETKYNFSGDPETGIGWTSYQGKVDNCGGAITGNVITVAGGDVRMILNYRKAGLKVNPGDTQIVLAAQVVARGSSNLNSVTLLKQKAAFAKDVCAGGFVIGVTTISTEVPSGFALEQNYPNPFNPATLIKFQIPVGNAYMHSVKLKIYDAIGREVATLVDEQLKPGTYEADWDATNFPSGVYFYKLEAGDYTLTKKMVLLK